MKRPMKSHVAEFNSYAEGYDGGMDHALKAFAGNGADDFVAVKVRWLSRHFPELWAGAAGAILDYGCGVATLLRLFRAAGVTASLTGTDVSRGMLDEAARTWPSSSTPPTLLAQTGAATGLPENSFDLAVISAVLHHVPIPDRVSVYAEFMGASAGRPSRGLRA